MKRMILSVLVGVLISGLSDSAKAEPSNSVQYLMNQPMSLFDKGLLFMNKEAAVNISRIIKRDLKIPIAVTKIGYSFKQNLIWVNITAARKGRTKISKRECKQIYEIAKENLGYIAKEATREVIRKYAGADNLHKNVQKGTFAHWFSSYTPVGIWKTMAGIIDIVKIKIGHIYANSTTWKTVCEGMLTDDNPMYGQ